MEIAEETDVVSSCAVANNFLLSAERRNRGGRKEPPARPPPITNNNLNNSLNSNKSNFVDDGSVTLRNPASISMESFRCDLDRN